MLIFIYFWHTWRPHIYIFGDRNMPLVTVIAGVHGNEPAPAFYLEELAAHLTAHPELVPRDKQLVIVAQANPAAIAADRRALIKNGYFEDLNRGWPDRNNKFLSPEIKKLVDRSSLVIDIHEAWGFEAHDPGSLGQTIFTTDPNLRFTVDTVIYQLNQIAGVEPYRQFYSLPEVDDGTTLDQYCERQQISYILIEIAGQNDIVAPVLRRLQCRVALQHLIRVNI